MKVCIYIYVVYKYSVKSHQHEAQEDNAYSSLKVLPLLNVTLTCICPCLAYENKNKQTLWKKRQSTHIKNATFNCLYPILNLMKISQGHQHQNKHHPEIH